MQEKQSLAVYITSKAMYGYLITNWLQRKKYRKSLHKFAKEALCCLLESCTAGEVEELVALVEVCWCGVLVWLAWCVLVMGGCCVRIW